MEIIINNDDFNLISGLSDGTTYYIQGFYKMFGVSKTKIDIELIQKESQPSNEENGLMNNSFKITKKSGKDIYIKSTQDNTILVVEEC